MADIVLNNNVTNSNCVSLNLKEDNYIMHEMTNVIDKHENLRHKMCDNCIDKALNPHPKKLDQIANGTWIWGLASNRLSTEWKNLCFCSEINQN